MTFGVRPRAFTLAGAATDRTISGAVELIEPMGAETLFHVRSGPLDMRVVVPREIRVQPGHVVHLPATRAGAFLRRRRKGGAMTDMDAPADRHVGSRRRHRRVQHHRVLHSSRWC